MVEPTQAIAQQAATLLLSAPVPVRLRTLDALHVASAQLAFARARWRAPKVAADRLGHDSVTLTLDTYTHAVAGLDADDAERMQRGVRGSG